MMNPLARCQRSRRVRLAIDFSTDCSCVSHAFDVCVMITSALLRTETERWREESRLLSSSEGLIGGFLGRRSGGLRHFASNSSPVTSH
jgi:hypothetical protein